MEENIKSIKSRYTMGCCDELAFSNIIGGAKVFFAFMSDTGDWDYGVFEVFIDQYQATVLEKYVP